jgi:hypothetical protein
MLLTKKLNTYKKIEELAAKINTLINKYNQIDAQITSLFISGYNKNSTHILTLESLKRAAKIEQNQIHSEIVKLKEEASII